MKKLKYILILLVVFHSSIKAQDLYVAADSYVFVQDEVIFVNNDIRLDSNDSNIYLREGAQLLQNSDTKNSDSGELSVYQQQTTGIYQYNFWCSPVGVSIEGTTRSNVNFDISNLHKPVAPLTNSNVLTNTYPTTNSYNSTAAEIAKYWLWKYESAEGYSGWEQISDFGNVKTGLGFSLKGSPTIKNTIDFRGRPNNGTITGSCLYTGGGTGEANTLTGNPYPSAMDLWMFLTHPANKSSLDGSIYFYEEVKIDSHYLKDYQNGYGVWTPLDETNPNDTGSYANAVFFTYDDNGEITNPTGTTGANYSGTFSRRFAAIGQGFMVESDAITNGGNFIIDNSMRVYMKQATSKSEDLAHFGKNNNSNTQDINKPQSHNGIDYASTINNPSTASEIRIHSKINELYYRENVLNLIPNKTLSYNKFGDAKQPSKLPSDNYFIADEKKLVIKSIEYDLETKLPFGFSAQNETNSFSITINSMKNISEEIDIYIHDKEMNTYSDIINGEFNITLPKGNYDNRFEIVFKNENVLDNGLIPEKDVKNSFNMFQNNKNKTFVIKNAKRYILKSFVIYDITGKIVHNKQNLGNELEYSFSTSNLSTGTYVTKTTTNQNFEITKKIIINN
jgi:hypothetical protein